MNFSLTYIGIITAVVVPVLGHVGFSSACSNEVVNVGLPLLGGVIAAIGRYRVGGINIFGVKQ